MEDGLAEAFLDEAAVPLLGTVPVVGAVVSGGLRGVRHQRLPSRTGMGWPEEGISRTCTLAPPPVSARRRRI